MSELVHLVSRHEAISKKFNTEKIHLSVRIKQKEESTAETSSEDIYQWYTQCFEEILKPIKGEFTPNDYIGIKIGIAGDNHTNPVGLAFRELSSLSAEIITDLLTLIQQSNESFNDQDLLNIEITIIKTPSGSGGQRVLLRRLNANNLMKHKSKSLILPKLREDYDMKCLPRALVLGMAKADSIDRYEMQKLLRKNSVLLERKTRKLIKKCKINVDSENGCFLNDLVKVSKSYPEYQIVVYNDMNDSKSILYKTIKTNKQINLFHIENHFIAIKTVKGLFGYRYQCKDCENLYNNPKTHKCSAKCNYCREVGLCPAVRAMLQCEQCNRRFRGPECFERHKKNEICKRLWICSNCSKFIDEDAIPEVKEHVCSDKFCNICKKIVAADHQCYIQPYSKKPPSKYCIIFFDLECTQNTPAQHTETGFSHKPNLCVAQQICHLCYNNDDDDLECKNCKQREFIFERNTCVEKFVDFCEVYRPYANSNICVIAHNFKSYDGHFIINELMKRNKPIKTVMNGLKILTILYDNHIRYIDSINFIPMALKKFPESFGLPSIQKGFYPHLFNTDANFDYVGSIPDRSFFPEDTLSREENADFAIWYCNWFITDKSYNNREELIKYCKMDVELLRRGCTRFMSDFIELADFNPFLQAITLAQTVMSVYRKNFMPRDQLGIIPQNNYSLNINQSFIGQKWLIYQNKDAGNAIKFEVRLQPSGLLVDGYDETTNTVYEFQV